MLFCILSGLFLMNQFKTHSQKQKITIVKAKGSTNVFYLCF